MAAESQAIDFKINLKNKENNPLIQIMQEFTSICHPTEKLAVR